MEQIQIRLTLMDSRHIWNVHETRRWFVDFSFFLKRQFIDSHQMTYLLSKTKTDWSDCLFRKWLTFKLIDWSWKLNAFRTSFTKSHVSFGSFFGLILFIFNDFNSKRFLELTHWKKYYRTIFEWTIVIYKINFQLNNFQRKKN